jgi:hypothetical protein
MLVTESAVSSGVWKRSSIASESWLKFWTRRRYKKNKKKQIGVQAYWRPCNKNNPMTHQHNKSVTQRYTYPPKIWVVWTHKLYNQLWKKRTKGSFGTHYFISFGINEMKWYDEIISFGKATKMTGYPIGIKIRHGMKIMEFEMNSVTNSVATKQVISRIANEFLDSSPK